jgi:hypothetical protein
VSEREHLKTIDWIENQSTGRVTDNEKLLQPFCGSGKAIWLFFKRSRETTVTIKKCWSERELNGL